MADKVLEFLELHNKPFTINDILQALAPIGKSALQPVLNGLVKEGKVMEKIYSKQRIYCIAQSTDLNPIKIREQALEIDRESNEAALKLEEVEESLKTNSFKLKELEGTMTVQEANDRKRVLVEEIYAMERQIKRLKEKTIDEDERKKVTKQYDEVLKEYKKRKRLCMDIVEAIFENYPKTKKQLLQDIGIETDEEADFKLT